MYRTSLETLAIPAHEAQEDAQASEEDPAAQVEELDDPRQDQGLLLERATRVVEKDVAGDDERRGKGQEQQPQAPRWP